MNRVNQYRQLAGITQAELAQLASVTRQTISLIERDQFNPSISLAINIAKALGTDLNALFWEDSNE
ncbi:helix-turn-helix transcriptional regulator [Weissella cibaria]|uniref:helix-turn-helix transcriptional regulator n=1 Tax=Weissella cibaria TaxID=137591 RepID=UPI000C000092|nr:helix-turn-helix transcriptional regulator [Weissella cibaria]